VLVYARRSGIDVTIPVPVHSVLLGLNKVDRTLTAVRFENNELIYTFTSDRHAEAS